MENQGLDLLKNRKPQDYIVLERQRNKHTNRGGAKGGPGKKGRFSVKNAPQRAIRGGPKDAPGRAKIGFWKQTRKEQRGYRPRKIGRRGEKGLNQYRDRE